ncbi:hypothetical protein ACOSP7_000748 [Xanthoceras sorbifolium]
MMILSTTASPIAPFFFCHPIETKDKTPQKFLALLLLADCSSLTLTMSIQFRGWISILNAWPKTKRKEALFYSCALCTFLRAACIFHNNHGNLKVISVLFRHCYWMI